LSIVWSKIKGPRESFAVVVATALGAGLLPLAPGTWGTLAAVPLAYVTADASFGARALMWVALTVIGTWSAKVLDQTFGSSDNQSIVIDEVIGYGITAWTAGTHPVNIVAAFALFRAFDILKPPPVRQADRWSKKKAAERDSRWAPWWGGFGVLFDDILAGFYGLFVMLLLQRAGFLPPA
jgi:phosphatidylglycerophosphatase A